MKNFPVRGRVYTLAEVYLLDLKDAPFLNVRVAGKLEPLQDEHMEKLQALPDGMASRWTYRLTTDEWIPLFDYAGDHGALLDSLGWFEVAVG